MINIRNPREYCENFLMIRDKKQQLVPLRYKPAQNELYEIIREEHSKGPVRLVVLKGRQMGCSTMIEGVFFADSATTENSDTLIIAHDEEATRHLFEMNKLFYDELPAALKPMMSASNAQELVFENPTKDMREKQKRPGLRSRIRCVTAGSKGAGRSFTFRNVHGSEAAFWPRFMQTHVAIMQAVPNEPDTCVIYETTANGMGEFKEFWDDAVTGRNGFRAVFLAWYKDPEYQMPVPAGTEWTDYEQEMMQRLGLTPEQLAWRRWCIATNCGNDEALFRQEYPSTPEEAFLTTGRPYFDNERIGLLIPGAPAPEHVGFFEFTEAENGKPENIEWREDPLHGYIRIWEMPERGMPYVIGADNAGDGTDRFTAYGIENTAGFQVLEYEYPSSERQFARQLWCMGEFFNWAVIALEVNFGSYAELMLEDWGYPNLFQRQRYDTIRKEYVKAFGFRTDNRTRPLAIGELRSVTEDTPETIRSRWLLSQMLLFQYDDHGKPQAISGEHDDLVMSAAICQMARPQQSSETAEENAPPPEKLIDKWEREKRRARRYR